MIALPNTRWFNNRFWHTFPYTYGVLRASLKDDYEVCLLDANHENLDFHEVRERIGAYGPDVVGISCMSLEYAAGYRKMSALAKEAFPEAIIVAGGIFPTLLPELVLTDGNLDYIILGEGDVRFPKFLRRLSQGGDLANLDGIGFRQGGKAIVQPVAGYIQDLDALPLPDYSDIDYGSYASVANRYSHFMYPKRLPYGNSITARGCPFNCIFCSSKAINGPAIRYRTAEHILREVDSLVAKYGIKEMIFLDDNFYLDRKRAIKIFTGLRERKHDLSWKSVNAAVYALDEEMLEHMRESGCYQLTLAIESGTEEGLKLLRKPGNIHAKAKKISRKAMDLGFEVAGSFVIGTPGETWAQIRKTFSYAEELELDYCSFNIATPLPRTALYETAKEGNMLPQNFDFNNLDFKGFGKASITTAEFTPEELQILRAFEWDRINFSRSGQEEKIAGMNGVTLEELRDWRVSTRRGLGVNVKYN